MLKRDRGTPLRDQVCMCVCVYMCVRARARNHTLLHMIQKLRKNCIAIVHSNLIQIRVEPSKRKQKAYAAIVKTTLSLSCFLRVVIRGLHEYPTIETPRVILFNKQYTAPMVCTQEQIIIDDELRVGARQTSFIIVFLSMSTHDLLTRCTSFSLPPVVLFSFRFFIE